MCAFGFKRTRRSGHPMSWIKQDKGGAPRRNDEEPRERLRDLIEPLDVVWLIGVFVVSLACGCVFGLVMLHMR